jgi:hypothetical protein
VVALAGRRIDAPNAEPRFPLANVPKVRKELERRLTTSVRWLVCSAACGADLLALETADRVGIPYHVVLPFAPSEFRKTSVVDRPGMNWGSIFDDIVAKATRSDRLWVDHLDPKAEDSFRTANLRILQLARELSDREPSVAGRDVRAMLVWEGRSRGPEDITDHFRREAEQHGFQIENVSTV